LQYSRKLRGIELEAEAEEFAVDGGVSGIQSAGEKSGVVSTDRMRRTRVVIGRAVAGRRSEENRGPRTRSRRGSSGQSSRWQEGRRSTGGASCESGASFTGVGEQPP
jgi:hypothetical protein